MTPEERALLGRRASEARRLGRDPMDYLDRNMHLLTRDTRNLIRAQTMHEVADLLEQTSITQVIRRYGSSTKTALDAQRGIVALIRDMARKEGS